MLGLWKYNRVTGYWDHQRGCAPETAQQWLEVFQRDEPQESFKLSRKRPSNKPLRNPTGE